MEKQQSATSSEYYEEEETVTSTVAPKQVKKGKSKKLLIDISDASTAQPLMEEVIKANSDKYRKSMDKKNANIRYVYCNAPDEDLIDILSQKGRTINRYPGIKGLSHKDSFTR